MGAFFGIRPIVGVVAVLSLVAWFATPAYAATYTVATTADNTGTCVPTSGKCSLRQLIDYEDGLAATPSPADVISVPAGTYNLTNGPLVIDQSVTIEGAGARATDIYQQTTSEASRVFDVQLNSKQGLTPTVTIADLATFFGEADSTNGYFGGDIRNQGNLTLDSDLIANGTTSSGSGAGISNYGGTMTVTDSLVENNDSEDIEGGGDSGGIQNYGDSSVGSGVLTLVDSTVADNDAALGGGIFSWCNSACSNSTTVIDSTIADNDGGSRGTTGGGLLASQGTISVQDSIVAGNFVTNANDAESASNCGSSSPGAITSLGYNIESASDCGFTATGDEQNTNPGFLNGLQDNGGQTDTFALDATSPAVDAIPTSNAGCTGTDQRGIARPQGTGCDIGAYELFQPEEGHQFTTVLGSVGATSAEISWGDGTANSAGSVDPSTGQVTGTHTYASAGDYDGTIFWNNDDGTPQATPFEFKVTVAPLVATPVSISPVSGVQFSGPVATFTDGNPDATASNFSAEINWGDGTESAGTISSGMNGFTVSGNHTYTHADTFKMSVAVTCTDGAESVASQTVTVKPPRPTVSDVSPSSGPPGGGTVVTITGTNFTNQSSVAFGTSAATSVTVNSGTQLTATAPAESAGTVDVTVTTAGGTSATSAADQYTYVAAPTVTGLSPAGGPTAGGTAVTITGSNFTGTPAVKFGTIAASSVKVESATQITATAPAGSAGTVDVTVTTLGGTSATGLADKYAYLPAPTVTGIAPTSGPSSGGTVVTITGTNLANTSSVLFGGTVAQIVSSGASQLTATAPAGSGTVDVTVVTLGGTSATDPSDRYTYQTVSVVSPGSPVVITPPAAPAVVAAAPTVEGSNGAAFAGAVNPENLSSTAYFEYGIDPSERGPGSSTLLYDETTPAQQVGSDSMDHAVSASVSGLQPNALYHVRLVATNSLGTTVGPDQTFTTAASAAPPPPVLGTAVNVAPVSGHVFILLPPGTSLGGAADNAALSKGTGFVPLTEVRQVPTGSEIDALNGSLKMVSNTGTVGKTQTATLTGGVFKLTQARTGITKGLTSFNLLENAFQGAPTYNICQPSHKATDATTASLSSKTLQFLKVSGHGKFRTTGRYSSATVRGTIYTVADRCNGTLTHVIRDTVLVDDFARHKTILLHAGQSYLAKKP